MDPPQIFWGVPTILNNYGKSECDHHKNTLGCCISYLNIILRGKNFEEKFDKNNFMSKNHIFQGVKFCFFQFQRKNGAYKMGIEIGLF